MTHKPLTKKGKSDGSSKPRAKKEPGAIKRTYTKRAKKDTDPSAKKDEKNDGNKGAAAIAITVDTTHKMDIDGQEDAVMQGSDGKNVQSNSEKNDSVTDGVGKAPQQPDTNVNKSGSVDKESTVKQPGEVAMEAANVESHSADPDVVKETSAVDAAEEPGTFTPPITEPVTTKSRKKGKGKQDGKSTAASKPEDKNSETAEGTNRKRNTVDSVPQEKNSRSKRQKKNE